MAPGPEQESSTGEADSPPPALQAATHTITLDWQTAPGRRSSPLAHPIRTGPGSGVVIACAGVTVVLVAGGAIGLWALQCNSSRRDSLHDLVEIPRPPPAARVAPPAAAASSTTNAIAAPVVAPDVAPATNLVRATIEPPRGALPPAPLSRPLDILAATAAMPTGSIAPATTAVDEPTSEQLPAAASQGSHAVRRASGLASATKARTRLRNTKWTSTFFDQ